jgi:pSer/pThr/pTyr-binding forkhead associated (FHA) protein
MTVRHGRRKIVTACTALHPITAYRPAEAIGRIHPPRIPADVEDVPYLVVRFNGEETHRLEFDGPITIGRDLACDIWIGDASLSRQHCRIEPDEFGRWIIRDLGSRNGVYYKDQRFTRFAARDGDTFRLGSAKFKFHSGKMPVLRPKTPLQAQHGSLMTPVVGPVSDHAAPALAAKQTRFHRRPLPTPRPKLESEANEPLTQPFSLAFQRPAPRPILEPLTPPAEEKPQPTQSSRNWIAGFFGRRAS